MMNRVSKVLLAGAIVAVVAAGGSGIAVATGGEDGSGTSVTGPALERATAAALKETGGGRVTGTEVGDEESYYEVEVTRGDGSQVDVQLDQAFNVVSAKTDVETEQSSDSAG